MGFLYSLSEESGVYRLLSHVYTIYPCADSIEWFIEDQAFLRSYDSAPFPPSTLPFSSARCLSFSVLMRIAGRAYWRERGDGGRGWARSQIIRSRKSLALYKSFNTLCLCVYQASLSHFSPSKQTSFCVPRLKKLIMVFIARNFLYKCVFLSSGPDCDLQKLSLFQLTNIWSKKEFIICMSRENEGVIGVGGRVRVKIWLISSK